MLTKNLAKILTGILIVGTGAHYYSRSLPPISPDHAISYEVAPLLTSPSERVKNTLDHFLTDNIQYPQNSLGSPDGKYCFLGDSPSNFDHVLGSQEVLYNFEKPLSKITVYLGPVENQSTLMILGELTKPAEIRGYELLKNIVLSPNANPSTHNIVIENSSKFRNSLKIINRGPGKVSIDSIENK